MIKSKIFGDHLHITARVCYNVSEDRAPATSTINGYTITSQPRVLVPSTAGGHEFAGAVEDN